MQRIVGAFAIFPRFQLARYIFGRLPRQFRKSVADALAGGTVTLATRRQPLRPVASIGQGSPDSDGLVVSPLWFFRLGCDQAPVVFRNRLPLVSGECFGDRLHDFIAATAIGKRIQLTNEVAAIKTRQPRIGGIGSALALCAVAGRACRRVAAITVSGDFPAISRMRRRAWTESRSTKMQNGTGCMSSYFSDCA